MKNMRCLRSLKYIYVLKTTCIIENIIYEIYNKKISTSIYIQRSYISDEQIIFLENSHKKSSSAS